MSDPTPPKDMSMWGDTTVAPGEQAEAFIAVSERYSGVALNIPIYIWRGTNPGPNVFVTAAVHGDEINGTGAIRQIIVDQPFTVTSGTVVLVPVVNIMGFERHSRYMPDRRDLNRSFPGTKDGSLASRLARIVYESVIKRCDYGIDLHTAAVRRTNFPNVRADMAKPEVAEFARAFGTELIVAGTGPAGSLRKAATDSGRPTIILEAGEVWKVEPAVVEYAVRGVTNCLAYLGMIDAKISKPSYRIETDKTQWVRATNGGFLNFHVAPGDIIEAGSPIATNTNLTGKEQNIIEAPRSGVVLGMTTLPSVAPGDPVCHLAFTKKGSLKKAETADADAKDSSLYQRAKDELASSVLVSDTKTPKSEDTTTAT